MTTPDNVLRGELQDRPIPAAELMAMRSLGEAYGNLKSWLFGTGYAMSESPRASAAEALWEAIGEFCWPDERWPDDPRPVE